MILTVFVVFIEVSWSMRRILIVERSRGVGIWVLLHRIDEIYIGRCIFAYCDVNYKFGTENSVKFGNIQRNFSNDEAEFHWGFSNFFQIDSSLWRLLLSVLLWLPGWVLGPYSQLGLRLNLDFGLQDFP